MLKWCPFAAAAVLLCIPVAESYFVPLCKFTDVKTAHATVFHANGIDVVVAKPAYNEVVAFIDNCPHRGASFNKAKLVNSTMLCNYHAFAFDLRTGLLTEGGGVAPHCTRLRNIPVLRRGNLIWGSLDGDLQYLPPELESEDTAVDYRSIFGSAKMKCAPQTLVENVLDAYHPSIIHSFGNRQDPEPKQYKVKKISHRRSVAQFSYQTGNTSLFSNSAVTVHNWFHTPSTAATRVIRDKDVKLVQIHAVDRGGGVTEVFYSLARNFWMWPVFDPFFQWAMKITLQEDRHVLETITPEAGNHINSRFDLLQLHYRAALRSDDVQ